MIDGINSRKEFDHEFNGDVDKWVKNWDKYKVELIKGAIDLKNLKRNKLGFR
jgi:hypothetical protein